MGKKKDRLKAKSLRNLDELVANEPDSGWQTGPVAAAVEEVEMADDAEEAPGTSGGRSKADLIAENPFGVLLMDTDELKAHRTKLKAKPAGNKLGVQLTGKRGNRTLNQARKKKVLLEKALAFTERNEAKADKLLNRKKGKLALKQLY